MAMQPIDPPPYVRLGPARATQLQGIVEELKKTGKPLCSHCMGTGFDPPTFYKLCVDCGGSGYGPDNQPEPATAAAGGPVRTPGSALRPKR